MGTFLCGDHTRLLSLLKFLGDVPAAAALSRHPRLPFPPHPDCPSSTAGVQRFPDTLLPPARWRPLSCPPRSRPSQHRPLPCCPFCRLASSSWLQSSVPFVGLKRPSATCPAPSMAPSPTSPDCGAESPPPGSPPCCLHAHCPQTACPGRLGASGRTGRNHQPGTGQALGERFMNGRNGIRRLKQKKRRPSADSPGSAPGTSQQLAAAARTPGSRRNGESVSFFFCLHQTPCLLGRIRNRGATPRHKWCTGARGTAPERGQRGTPGCGRTTWPPRVLAGKTGESGCLRAPWGPFLAHPWA